MRMIYHLHLKPGSQLEQLLIKLDFIKNGTIPHSNAGEERIFSYINNNKTPSRNSLSLVGTLSSIITVKTHIEDPLQWCPSQSLIKAAKKATVTYNEKHKKQLCLYFCIILYFNSQAAKCYFHLSQEPLCSSWFSHYHEGKSHYR